MDTHVKLFSVLATIAIAMLIATDAQAQCSGGGSRSGRGGGQPPTTGSTSQFTSLYNNANMLAYQRQIAYQQQLYAMQQQQSSEIADRLYAQRQELQAMRLARADANRAKRAERIAVRKAQRLGESSGSMIASSASRSRLVSVQDASPFD